MLYGLFLYKTDILSVLIWDPTKPRRAVGNMSDCKSRGRKLILARSHTFTEIDLEIISSAILLPSANPRRIVVSYKQKYVHKVLVNCLVKLAQEKSEVR